MAAFFMPEGQSSIVYIDGFNTRSAVALQQNELRMRLAVENKAVRERDPRPESPAADLVC